MYSNNTEILRTRFTIVWYSINGECYTGLDVTITPELKGMPTGLTGANEDSILQLPFLWQMSEPKWKKKFKKMNIYSFANENSVITPVFKSPWSMLNMSFLIPVKITLYNLAGFFFLSVKK